jgi:Winged helix DNA-binding domain
VLVDGEIVGIWRARTKGTRLEVSVEPFGRPARRARDAIEEEAVRLAPFRECESVEVTFA